MSNLNLIRASSDHPGFIQLVKLLDEDLALRDGAEHGFYAQYNTTTAIKEVVVAYQNQIPVACGAIKKYDETTAEVKRMFVKPDYRNRGIAAQVLTELEQWVLELNFATCILETGKRQPEAIRLYQKVGYQITPNYGQYINVENSVCMAKSLR